MEQSCECLECPVCICVEEEAPPRFILIPIGEFFGDMLLADCHIDENNIVWQELPNPEWTN